MYSLTLPDRNRPGSRDGSGPSGATRSGFPAKLRSVARLARHRSNNWDKSGRRGVTGGTPFYDIPPESSPLPYGECWSRSLPASLIQQAPPEFIFNRFEGKVGRSLAGDHEDIKTRGTFMAPAAEKLPDQPLDAVALHRVAHLAADGNPQPRFALAAGFADNQKIGGVNLPATARDSEKLVALS